MNQPNKTAIIEALIFASEKPLPINDIHNILLEDFPTQLLDETLQTIETIQKKYQEADLPFQIIYSGAGYQMVTKSEYYTYVQKLNGDKYVKKLSTSAMETLSVIAYRQPVTKSDIEFIRGVNCDYSIQKLLEKELIIISGRKEDAIGKPLLYQTSKHFMDYLGINGTNELPQLKEMQQLPVSIPSPGLKQTDQEKNNPLPDLFEGTSASELKE